MLLALWGLSDVLFPGKSTTLRPGCSERRARCVAKHSCASRVVGAAGLGGQGRIAVGPQTGRAVVRRGPRGAELRGPRACVAGLTNGFGGARSEQELGGAPGRRAAPRRRCASESSISSSSSPLCDSRWARLGGPAPTRPVPGGLPCASSPEIGSVTTEETNRFSVCGYVYSVFSSRSLPLAEG